MNEMRTRYLFLLKENFKIPIHQIYTILNADWTVPSVHQTELPPQQKKYKPTRVGNNQRIIQILYFDLDWFKLLIFGWCLRKREE